MHTNPVTGTLLPYSCNVIALVFYILTDAEVILCIAALNHLQGYVLIWFAGFVNNMYSDVFSHIL